MEGNKKGAKQATKKGSNVRAQKNKKIGSVIGWIVGCIVFLVLTQIIFSIPAPNRWLQAVWGAGDLISFVGTIVLGLVAVMQTREANSMSNRLMQLEENRYKLETRPFVMLKDWSSFFKNYYQIIRYSEEIYVQSTYFELEKGTTAFCVSLELLNTTQAYISVQVKSVEYVDGNKPVFNVESYINTTNMSLRLNPGESGNIVFWGDTQIMKDALRQGRIRFNFILENRFGERYQESFDAVVIVTGPLKKEDAPLVIFHASDYRIGKFVKGLDGKPTLEWEDTNNGQA